MKVHLVMHLVFCGVAMAGLPACKQYAKADFEVTLTNRTRTPITAGFVKDGAPAERHWAAPHEVAMGGGRSDQWGEVVRPGETKKLGPIGGKFDEGVSAILRLYGAEGGIDDLMGFARNDPMRVDIYLYPGATHYLVDEERGRLLPSRAPSR